MGLGVPSESPTRPNTPQPRFGSHGSTERNWSKFQNSAAGSVFPFNGNVEWWKDDSRILSDRGKLTTGPDAAHQELDNELIVPLSGPPNIDTEINATERLGGLLRAYHGAAQRARYLWNDCPDCNVAALRTDMG